jgi:hypothetical protein
VIEGAPIKFEFFSDSVGVLGTLTLHDAGTGVVRTLAPDERVYLQSVVIQANANGIGGLSMVLYDDANGDLGDPKPNEALLITHFLFPGSFTSRFNSAEGVAGGMGRPISVFTVGNAGPDGLNITGIGVIRRT